jgi:hypothetical protein
MVYTIFAYENVSCLSDDFVTSFIAWRHVVELIKNAFEEDTVSWLFVD